MVFGVFLITGGVSRCAASAGSNAGLCQEELGIQALHISLALHQIAVYSLGGISPLFFIFNTVMLGAVCTYVIIF